MKAESITIEDIYKAYYDCRKHKRNTFNALEFEVNLERNLYKLWEDINNGSYQIGTSICFIVDFPKKREVFAADFRDRIVHHLVIRKVEALFEEKFIHDTYNCRVGKGTLYGIKRLSEKIREASEDYTKDVYLAKFDCKGFFMSIRKEQLADMVTAFLEERYAEKDKEIIIKLLRQIILHSPEKKCVIKGSREKWRGLDKSKSLFTCGEGLGLPIGNLSSQVLANFYLSDFDIMMSRMFDGMYGRYVDDYYVISESKEKILSSIEVAREFLSRYGVTLHPKKVYIQHYSKGIKFIGATIKFGRTYVNNSTLHHFKRCINEINSIKDKESYAPKAVQRLNSYLGYLRQFLTYGIRIQIIKTLSPEWRRYIYVTGRKWY